jgi:hypothetical protein
MSQLQGNSVRLGRIRGTTRELVMSAEDRQTHLWLPGNTGVGKSKMLESMICQDIDAWGTGRHGLMLIDPHGSVYRNVVKYLAERRLNRPVVLVELSSDRWTVGYNPLKVRAGEDPSVIVRGLVEAMAFAFGERDTQATPRFAAIASAVLMALLETGRPLLDAYHVASNRRAMAMLAERVTEGFAKAKLRELAATNDREFPSLVESTLARLRPFSQSQRFKAIFGHTGHSLDFLDVLRSGAIVLVNLERGQNRLSVEDVKLFGTLLLTDLWRAAQSMRKPDDGSKIHPFYLYVDEAQNFITPTLAQNLTEARGYGLNLIIANQYPSQFKSAGDNGTALYDALMAAARSKIVFQMNHADDRTALAAELHAGELDPMKVKRRTTSVVRYDREESVSRTSGSSSQEGGTRTEQTGTSRGRSQREQRDDDGREQPINASEQEIENEANSTNWADGSSESTTRVEVLVPVMGEEVAEYMSLDEQRATFEQAIACQDKQECLVRLVSMRAALGIRTLDVLPAWVSERRVEAYVEKVRKSLGYMIPLSDALEAAVHRERNFDASLRSDHVTDEATTSRRKLNGANPKM